VRTTLAAVLFLFAAPLAVAETVVTHCSTETVHLAVQHSDPIDVRRLGSCSDDQPNNALWFLDRLDSVDGALDGHFTRTPASALVYVLDTGVEINHDEFADGNVIAGIDVQLERGFAPDCNTTNAALHPCFDLASPITVGVYTHGTGVASIIGGRRVGVAPGVKIISVNALGTPEVTNWLVVFNDVIKKAWDPSTPDVKTAIINMSAQLGGYPAAGDLPYSQPEQKIRDMVGGVDRNGNPDPNGKRFLFVVAAGNTGPLRFDGKGLGDCDLNNQVHAYPATLGPSIAGLITVGGVGRDNRFWAGSCRGPALELLAPAEDMMPAIGSGHDHYRLAILTGALFSSGTSYSAPIVSGAAAQILAREPNLTPAEVELRLEATPSSIADAPDGTAGGKVVYIVHPSEPRRRAVR
jgi:subtilisin family serine protease